MTRVQPTGTIFCVFPAVRNPPPPPPHPVEQEWNPTFGGSMSEAVLTLSELHDGGGRHRWRRAREGAGSPGLHTYSGIWKAKSPPPGKWLESTTKWGPLATVCTHCRATICTLHGKTIMPCLYSMSLQTEGCLVLITRLLSLQSKADVWRWTPVCFHLK